MFRISSNLSQVIERTRRLRDRDIPAALQAALQPSRWKGMAAQEARDTIGAIAEDGDKQFIEPFIKTIYATLFEGGLLLGMQDPSTHFSLAVAQLGLPGTAGQKYQEVRVDDPVEFEQQVLDWVANEKRWDIERDGEKTLENIYEKAAWITRLILAPPGTLSAVPSSYNSMSELEARDSLIEPVMEYILKQTSGTPSAPQIAPETAATWLRAVLSAWREMVRVNYPRLVKQSVREMRRAA